MLGSSELQLLQELTVWPKVTVDYIWENVYSDLYFLMDFLYFIENVQDYFYIL